jgi:hypothetical protein
MEEDDKLFREDELRENALSRAIYVLTKQPVSHTPQDIVNVAEIFYQFLKGETK